MVQILKRLLWASVFFSLQTSACINLIEFKTDNLYQSIDIQGYSIDELNQSLSLNLILPVGNASINLSNPSFSTVSTVPKAIWYARFLPGQKVETIQRDYRINSYDGRIGLISSVKDAHSIISIQLIESRVEQQLISNAAGETELLLTGYIQLNMDLSQAYLSGDYAGQIQVDLNCL